MRTSARLTLLVLGTPMLVGCATFDRRFDGPFGTSRLKVEINGVYSGEVLKVSEFSSESPVVEYKDGGDFVVHKMPGGTSYANIVIQRCVDNDPSWWEWRKKIVDGKTDKRAGTIRVLDRAGNEVRRWNILAAWPAAYRIRLVKSHHHKLIIEEMELAVEKIESGSPPP